MDNSIGSLVIEILSFRQKKKSLLYIIEYEIFWLYNTSICDATKLERGSKKSLIQ